MQLQKWSTVNRRLFATGSGPSRKEWMQLITEHAINGRIIGDMVFIDIDQLAANTVLSEKKQDDIPDLLS